MPFEPSLFLTKGFSKTYQDKFGAKPADAVAVTEPPIIATISVIPHPDYPGGGLIVVSDGPYTPPSSNVPPTVTSQPVNRTITAGSNTAFLIGASGTPAPTYQWQVNTGSGFTNIVSGGQSSTLSITNATTGMSGYTYRCIVTNAAGTVTSNVVTLTVNAAAGPSVASYSANGQASTRSVSLGGGAGNIPLVITWGGSPTSYQWQSAPNQGGPGTWTNISGATSNTYNADGAAINSSGSTMFYRCIATNASGSTTGPVPANPASTNCFEINPFDP